MHELEEVRRRIDGGESLLAITGAMKALAAVRIRRFREAARAVASYEETLERGLQVALRKGTLRAVLPEVAEVGPTGAAVFGSNLGLAGPFNARIAEFAVDRLADAARSGAPPVRILAVGQRLVPHLEAAGFPPEEVLDVPGSVEGLGAGAQDVVLSLARWRDGGVERIQVYHQHSTTGATFRARERQLLPLDPGWLEDLARRPWDSRVLPMTREPWEDLFSHLIREVLFIAVYRALADSLASEQASRLVAMETAEARIEEHLQELRSSFARRRQQAITEELLELTVGYRAIVGSQRDA